MQNSTRPSAMCLTGLTTRASWGRRSTLWTTKNASHGRRRYGVGMCVWGRGGGSSGEDHGRDPVHAEPQGTHLTKKCEGKSRCVRGRKTSATAHMCTRLCYSIHVRTNALTYVDVIDASTQHTHLRTHARTFAVPQESLYDEWSSQVFDRIQDRLQKAVSQRSHRSIERRLNVSAPTFCV